MDRLTKLEQETIIVFNELENGAEVFTYNNALKRKLHGLCEKFPDQFGFDSKRSEQNNCGGEFFVVPKKYITVSSPRVLSEDQKERKREQARKNLKSASEDDKVS